MSSRPRVLPRLRSKLGSIRRPILLGMAICLTKITVTAAPFTEATVTRLQNLVSYGESVDGKTRKAVVADVIRANNYLLTEVDSRAELRYPDGSLVRIGQNTIFSFDASSRTLALEKGTFIFFVPKGSGGGRIKTPSLTAAITGTVGKVSENTIAILEGQVTLVPSGRVVRAGFFARRNPDGTITIARFDPKSAWEGKLIRFNGPIPGFEEPPQTQPEIVFDTRDLRQFETLQRTNNTPSAVKEFFPEPPRPRVESEPEPEAPPPPPPRPRPRPRPEPPIRD